MTILRPKYTGIDNNCVPNSVYNLLHWHENIENVYSQFPTRENGYLSTEISEIAKAIEPLFYVGNIYASRNIPLTYKRLLREFSFSIENELELYYLCIAVVQRGDRCHSLAVYINCDGINCIVMDSAWPGLISQCTIKEFLDKNFVYHLCCIVVRSDADYAAAMIPKEQLQIWKS